MFVDYKLSNNNLTIKTTEDTNFVLKIEKYYPFNTYWSFSDYKLDTSKSYAFKAIRKLTYPQLLFTNFKYERQIFPFFNPSIIRIDTIDNYYNFMSSQINSFKHINDINHTKYLVIGRWNGHQCKQSYKYFNDTYYIHFKNINYFQYCLTQNGIHLLDKNFNILQHIILKLSYDKNCEKNYVKRPKKRRQCKRHLKHLHVDLQDCRLVTHLSIVFIYCISYEEAYHIIGYIGALLWKEEYTNNNKNNKTQIVAYLEAKSDTNYFFKMKQFYYKPNSPIFGLNPKNLIAFQYDKKLYFLWELTNSYFIEIDLLNKSNKNKAVTYGKYGIFEQIEGIYIHHNNKSFYSKHNINNSMHLLSNVVSYHQNVGFIHLTQTNEFLGVGHIHYDLYDNKKQHGIQYGHHYTHFFYTISDILPFQMKRMSVEFCFNSPYKRKNSSTDCDVIQFVSGIVENTINGFEYLFIYYGINDCTSSILRIQKQTVIHMLTPVNYML